jgi:hypothetical protein
MPLIIAKWIGVVLGFLGLAWAVYAGIIRPVTKPNPSSSTAQEAKEIINYTVTIQPRQSFGCTNFQIQRIPEDKIKIEVKR